MADAPSETAPRLRDVAAMAGVDFDALAKMNEFVGRISQNHSDPQRSKDAGDFDVAEVAPLSDKAAAFYAYVRENLPDDHEDPDAVAKAFLELNENLLDNPDAWHTAVPPKPQPRPHARRRRAPG